MFFDELDSPEFRKALECTHFHTQDSKIGQHLVTYLTIERFEELLWLAWHHDRKNVQISRNSEQLDGEKRALDIIRISEQVLKDGFSIIVNFAETFDSKIASLCAGLGEKMGGVVNAAIFLTPPSTKAFRPHYDTMEVYAVQLIGSKRWQLSRKATELPLTKNTLPNDTGFENPEDIVLESGDMLYAPRGQAHSVTVGEEAYSLHISFALNPISISDVLLENINSKKRSSKLMREGYNAFQHKGEGFESLGQINKEATNKYILEKAYKNLKAQNFSKMNQVPGVLSGLINFGKLENASNMYYRRLGTPLEVVLLEDAKNVAIGFPGLAQGRFSADRSLLIFPSAALTMLEFIRDNKNGFFIENIPGPLNIESKTTILDRLKFEKVIEKK